MYDGKRRTTKVSMWEADLQSLYAGDDGVERSLDVGRGAGADHW